MVLPFGPAPRQEKESVLRGSPRLELLGIRIAALRLPDLLRAVLQAIARNQRITVVYVNIHCMNVATHDPEYAAVLGSADIVYCDGTGVRLGARASGQCLPERMTGADWIHDLARTAVRDDLSLFLLGDAPGVAQSAARRLEVTYPGLRIVGVQSGYDIPSGIAETINRAAPDILLVGMGTPRQEKWIAKHRSELDVPVVWAVGALFSFVSGRIPRGPRWMTSHGLEWLCRLAAEPRKLWRRYLFGNPIFVWRVARTYWWRQ